MKTKSIALLSILFPLFTAGVAGSTYDNRAPEVPETLQVPVGYDAQVDLGALPNGSYQLRTINGAHALPVQVQH